MPAALEKKLKQEADKKGIKDKDAYVYGTLRKTGWKPNREKKMSDLSESRLIRLAKIDDHLDHVIRFDYNDDDQDKRSLVGGLAKVGAAGAVGAGATLGHQAIQSTGGYTKNWMAGKAAFGRSFANPAKGMQGIAKGPGRVVGQQIGGALAKLKEVLPSLRLSSKHPEIRLDETILSPWQGSLTKSKIAQEQFPAGPNPDFAPWAKNLSREEMLKLPFPKLMQFLNQRNLLQQRFSWKRERLVELNAKLDEIQLR